MPNRPIVVSEPNARVLRGLLAGRPDNRHDQEHLHALRAELERAHVLEPSQMPAEVVTLQASVQIRDLESGQRQQLILVGPSDADVSAQRISVLAPLGTALLGYREGDDIEWSMPGGLRRLRIERVLQSDVRPGAPGDGVS